jgi:hypothetical protein
MEVNCTEPFPRSSSRLSSGPISAGAGSSCLALEMFLTDKPGNTKGRGSITVPLTSCLTDLESAV